MDFYRSGVFKDLDLVEYLGSGIPRILRAYSSDAFDFTENFLRIRFALSKMSSEISSEKTEAQILNLLLRDPKITTKKLADALDLSTRAIEKQLSKLKDQGVLERIGSDKGGEWKVIGKRKT